MHAKNITISILCQTENKINEAISYFVAPLFVIPPVESCFYKAFTKVLLDLYQERPLNITTANAYKMICPNNPRYIGCSNLYRSAS